MIRVELPSSLLLVILLAWIGAGLATYVDALVLDADWRVAALASLGVVVFTLVVLAGIGRPWRRWQRTPYW